jgi:hypothetical protein
MRFPVINFFSCAESMISASVCAPCRGERQLRAMAIASPNIPGRAVAGAASILRHPLPSGHFPRRRTVWNLQDAVTDGHAWLSLGKHPQVAHRIARYDADI